MKFLCDEDDVIPSNSELYKKNVDAAVYFCNSRKNCLFFTMDNDGKIVFCENMTKAEEGKGYTYIDLLKLGKRKDLLMSKLSFNINLVPNTTLSGPRCQKQIIKTVLTIDELNKVLLPNAIIEFDISKESDVTLSVYESSCKKQTMTYGSILCL